LNFWAATTFADNPSAAYFLAFKNGALNIALKTDLDYVRAVRTAW
jgi:hypothetical protein